MSPRRSQPKRGGRTTFTVPGDPSDPEGFAAVGADWLEWLAAHNYAHTTLIDRSFYLAKFVAWAGAAECLPARDVTLPVLEAYQRHVSLRRKSDGMPLSWSTQSKCLIPLRAFFSWAAKSRRIAYNPASELVMPRQEHKLPSATLSHDEAELVLSVPDTTTPIGLRDRTVMELLYATAMRRGEVVGLDLPDVDLARRWLTLRHTKNRWDRVVPMGERAAAWLVRYLADARPELVGRRRSRCGVPRHQRGAPGGHVADRGRSTATSRGRGSGKTGSCHLFRHSAATLMVERGADIRYVQELLGHRDLSSTHIYTRVAPERLAAIHAATHPGAVLATGHDDNEAGT